MESLPGRTGEAEADERSWDCQPSELQGSRDLEDIAGPSRTLKHKHTDTGKGEEVDVWVLQRLLAKSECWARENQDHKTEDLKATSRHNDSAVFAAQEFGSRK